MASAINPTIPPPKQIRFVNNQGQPPSKRRRINAASVLFFSFFSWHPPPCGRGIGGVGVWRAGRRPSCDPPSNLSRELFCPVWCRDGVVPSL